MDWKKDRAQSAALGGIGGAILRSAHENIKKERNGEGNTTNKISIVGQIALGLWSLYKAIFRK